MIDGLEMVAKRFAAALFFAVVVVASVVLGLPAWVSSPMTRMVKGIEKLSRLILATCFFVVVVVASVVLGFPAWISLPVMTGMMEGIEDDILESEKQYEKSLPLLGGMGYDVTSFKVVGGGWGLLPWAKLCLLSKMTTGTDPHCIKTDSHFIELEKIERQAEGGGWLMMALISSASAAKKIQCSNTSFDTLVIQIDVAVPPKIKTSYSNSKLTTDKKDPPEPYIEGLDPACGQANSGK